jgi:hypothetical protein
MSDATTADVSQGRSMAKYRRNGLDIAAGISSEKK